MSDESDFLLKYFELHEKKLDNMDGMLNKINESVHEHNLILERLTVILDEHQKRSTSLEELVQIHRDESKVHDKEIDVRLEVLEKPIKVLSTLKTWIIRLAGFLGALVSIAAALRYFGII